MNTFNYSEQKGKVLFKDLGSRQASGHTYFQFTLDKTKREN